MKALALLTLVACTDIPATPSFQQDVAPILAANCGRCHGGPTIGGVTEDMRITYPTAQPAAVTIAMRVEAGEMPPRWPLEDDQIEIIVRWSEQLDEFGLPGARGEPRPGNRAPVLNMTETAEAVFEYTLYDPDGDLVEGRLEIDGVRRVDYKLHQGRDVIVIDRAVLMPGMHDVVAILDDGGAETRADIGTVRVP